MCAFVCVYVLCMYSYAFMLVCMYVYMNACISNIHFVYSVCGVSFDFQYKHQLFSYTVLTDVSLYRERVLFGRIGIEIVSAHV